ncbi:MAG: hypothetical protein OEM81_14430 [Acidimicrobiia bacterium]|nr:hypothetical protein [Acidimicrobiia bacterium]
MAGPFGLFGALTTSGVSTLAFLPFVALVVFLLATGIHMITSTQKTWQPPRTGVEF